MNVSFEKATTLSVEQARVEIEHFAEMEDSLAAPIVGTAVEQAIEDGRRKKLNSFMLEAFSSDVIPTFLGRTAGHIHDKAWFQTHDQAEARKIQASVFWIPNDRSYLPYYLLGSRPSQEKGMSDFLFQGASVDGLNIGQGVIGRKTPRLESLLLNPRNLDVQIKESKSNLGKNYSATELESGGYNRMLNVNTGELRLDQTVAGAMGIHSVRNLSKRERIVYIFPEERTGHINPFKELGEGEQYDDGFFINERTSLYKRKMRKAQPKDGITRSGYLTIEGRWPRPRDSDLLEYGTLAHMADLAAFHDKTDDLSELLETSIDLRQES